MSGVGDTLALAAASLGAAGVESARHDAEVLLAHTLGTSRRELVGHAALDAAQLRAFACFVDRRGAREPLQHITGTAGFRYLDLAVGSGVFVPRPETEVMAGLAVDELQRLVAGGVGSPLAVDLCSGSGAIALALATEVSGAHVTAVEVSRQAQDYALRNSRGVANVEMRLGDIADSVDDLAGLVHVVTANPPYIPLSAFESVPSEVRDFDPPVALWSGQDGLDTIRVVARVAARLLVDGGLVLCEHADVQEESAPGVFAATGEWTRVRDNRDLAARPRFVSARRVGRPRLRLAR